MNTKTRSRSIRITVEQDKWTKENFFNLGKFIREKLAEEIRRRRLFAHNEELEKL